MGGADGAACLDRGARCPDRVRIAGGVGHGRVPAFQKTEKISRIHLVDGKNDVVDRRTFSVTVAQDISAAGQPGDQRALGRARIRPAASSPTRTRRSLRSEKEYPVVLMMCRGDSSSSAPAAKQISPSTCWTQTPAERFQFSTEKQLPVSYRLDRYGRRQVPARCRSEQTGKAGAAGMGGALARCAALGAVRGRERSHLSGRPERMRGLAA